MSNHENNEQIITNTKGGARPMKILIDKNGNEWLCDKNVNESGDLASQGCWRTDQMSFDRNF